MRKCNADHELIYKTLFVACLLNLWCTSQKLEQLVGLLAPGKNTQRDATMLENVLYEVCEKAMKENTTLGELLRGPSALSSGVSSSKLSLPGALPIWKRGQLENMKRYRLPNGRRLTITCSQVACQNTTASLTCTET